MAISDIPTNANVTASHVFYKVKTTTDDISLKMKARIAFRRN